MRQTSLTTISRRQAVQNAAEKYKLPYQFIEIMCNYKDSKVTQQ